MEQIAVKPHDSIKFTKRGSRLRADKPTIPHQATHDGAILLLHMRLIILSIGARARHFQFLAGAPGDDELVHEGAVVVEIYAEQGEGKERAGLLDRERHEPPHLA
ncbi:MAG: hypothetical protein E5W19_28605 [Mesorhizobium sp.]|nr:MAG: hypothetical protein E5W19_28605 [Mesorhizobium sp.]